jgi:hypothetical protein
MGLGGEAAAMVMVGMNTEPRIKDMARSKDMARTN